MNDIFEPGRLGPLTLRNRVVKAATFEGLSSKGVVTDRLVDFHRAVAEGGVAMTTLAFCAVSRDGRGAPGEIVVGEETGEGLRRFTDEMHRLDTAASVQLGHAGPVGAAAGRTALAPSRVFAPQAMRFTRAIDPGEIDRVIGDFVRSSAVAADAGFDCIELHFGHGYLPSAFLSPKLNKRTDEWGGSIENRSRFARRIAVGVRERIGDRIALVAKLNMADGVRGGLTTADAVAAAQLLEHDGALDALVLTGGSSFQNPMYLFRGPPPTREIAARFPPLMRAGLRLSARRFMPHYPFEEAYFLDDARAFRRALRMPLVLLGGITRANTVRRALEEGFAFSALARALLREPGLVNGWRADDARESQCTHCNKCIPTIYSGTHCVLVQPRDRPGGTHEIGAAPKEP